MKRGCALLEERGDALGEVGGAGRLLLQLAPRARAAPRASRRRRGRTGASSSRSRGSAASRRSPPPRRRARRAGRPRRPRRRAPTRGLRRRSSVVRRHPVERAREAEQPVDEPRAAGVGDEADADEAGDERGGVARDPEVAGGCEREPGAGAGAVDGGDDGLLERRGSGGCSGGRSARAGRGSSPATSWNSFRSWPEQKPRPAPVITTARTSGVARLLERGAQGRVQGRVEGVEHLRPVERDRQDGAVARGEHFAHGASLKGQAKSARTRPIASGASR